MLFLATHRRRVFFRVCLCVSALVAGPALAQPNESPVGFWVTVDDDGKTRKAVVQIEKRGMQLIGKIVRLINPKKKDPTCDDCDGRNRGKPVLGMEILWGLRRDGEEWSGGHILDPENGKVYQCIVEVVEGGKQLKVRGYIGLSLLGRTQYWFRASNANGG